MSKQPEFILALDVSTPLFLINKGVYKITNIVNNKIYIGSTGSKGGFKKRWSYHLQDLRKDKHHSIHLQARPILQYSLSGDFIKEFGSATSAANELKISAKSIRQCTNNRIKTSGGFIWKFKNL
jgi:hypothetical protein